MGDGLFTLECAWSKINSGLKRKTVFVSPPFPIKQTLETNPKQSTSVRKSKSTCKPCELAHQGKKLSNQASQRVMSSFRSSFTYLVRPEPLPSIPLYIEGPGLIIDPADRKQLKRSQTQEGFWNQIGLEKDLKKNSGMGGGGKVQPSPRMVLAYTTVK